MLNKVKLFNRLDKNFKRLLIRELLAGLLQHRKKSPRDADSIAACRDWFLNAAEQTAAEGLPALFSLTSGYTAAYPETTGYIVPTLYRYAKVYDDNAVRKVAKSCAQWLVAIQKQEGSIEAGYVGMNLPGCIFNTGMALFGYLAAYSEERDSQYMDAARRAALWLVESMDEDGCWRKNLSQFAAPTSFHTYNVRVAWALSKYAGVSKDDQTISAVKRHLNWAVTQANAEGFFSGCEMAGFDQPLTHTIAYTLRGLLESGISVGEESAIDTAMRGIRSLQQRQRPNGGYSGLFDQNWQERATWDCLTGSAQVTILMFRAWQRTQQRTFLMAFNKGIEWLKSNQIIAPHIPEVHGGLLGSFPIYGGYHPYSIPNWAVKFLLDALLLRQTIAQSPEKIL